MTNVSPSSGNTKHLSNSPQGALSALASPKDHAATHAVVLANYGASEAQDALNLIDQDDERVLIRGATESTRWCR